MNAFQPPVPVAPRTAGLALAAAILAALPAAAQEWAVERLEASPRHHEWVEVPAGDERTVRSFVAYPERAEGATAVLVIHENRGLTDWVRSFADQLAAAGYLAVAPDLLSGFSAERPHTGAFASSDAAREALYQLDGDRVLADLLAVERWAAARPGASGTTAVAGFCWGGAQAFRFATHSADVDAAFVFYGTGPEDEARIAAAAAPVYGFYGENDERVNATIEPTKQRMAAAGKTYEPVVYEGAGHAFMRQADDPEGPEAARAAKAAAWQRLTMLLESLD
jgi:carboxymethylenebutenolidase